MPQFPGFTKFLRAILPVRSLVFVTFTPANKLTDRFAEPTNRVDRFRRSFEYENTNWIDCRDWNRKRGLLADLTTEQVMTTHSFPINAFRLIIAGSVPGVTITGAWASSRFVVLREKQSNEN